MFDVDRLELPQDPCRALAGLGVMESLSPGSFGQDDRRLFVLAMLHHSEIFAVTLLLQFWVIPRCGLPVIFSSVVLHWGWLYRFGRKR